MEEKTLGKPLWADPEFICFIHHKITFAWYSKLKYDLADGSCGIGTKNFQVDVWERMWHRQRWIFLILASSCNILYLPLSCVLGTGICCSYSLLVQLSLATMVHKRPRPHQVPKLPPILLCRRPESSAQGCCGSVTSAPPGLAGCPTASTPTHHRESHSRDTHLNNNSTSHSGATSLSPPSSHWSLF